MKTIKNMEDTFFNFQMEYLNEGILMTTAIMQHPVVRYGNFIVTK